MPPEVNEQRKKRRMDVAQAIKKLRKERGLTQAQMADLCCMTANGVSVLERGRSFPPSSTVERICSALHIPVAYLLLASIEEEDFPDNKRMLYRLQLEPLRRELLTHED